MSRYYDMFVEISDFDPKKATEIEEKATAEWPFNDWYLNQGKSLSGSGRANLFGGETDSKFSRRLALAIWRANGAVCTVNVIATHLEDQPHENYEYGQNSELAKEWRASH